jgi:hypothetical protein
MKKKVKARRGSHTVLTVALLPLLIFTFMAGWILIQIGRILDFQKNKEKNLELNYQFEKHIEKSEKSDKESRKTKEPQIIT